MDPLAEDGCTMPPDIYGMPLTFEDRLRALGWFIDNRDLHSINLTIEQGPSP